uniref:Uncharacterized protein n=1 Tax=Anguilla anguilla TaxID=7936 RepID=A0A0E9SU44_ANGAN
MPLFNALVSA